MRLIETCKRNPIHWDRSNERRHGAKVMVALFSAPAILFSGGCSKDKAEVAPTKYGIALINDRGTTTASGDGQSMTETIEG